MEIIEKEDILKDPNILEKVISYRDNILKNNTISRGTVVSLENFLGFGLITETIHANKFTNNESCALVEDSIEILDKAINRHSKGDFSKLVTLQDVVKNANKALYQLENIEYLLTQFGKTNKETWNRIFNEKYVFYFKDWDDTSVTNVDIYNYTENTDILWAFAYNKNYITGVCTSAEGTLDLNKINSIYNFVNEVYERSDSSYGRTSSHYQLFSFLEMLADDKDFYLYSERSLDFNLNNFDIVRIYKNIFNNIDTILSAITKIKEELVYCKDETSRVDYYSYRNKDYLVNQVKMFNNLENIFSDKHTENILRLFNLISE